MLRLVRLAKEAALQVTFDNIIATYSSDHSSVDRGMNLNACRPSILLCYCDVGHAEASFFDAFLNPIIYFPGAGYSSN